MSGPIALKSQKALLTRYCNNLSKVISKAQSIADGERMAFPDQDKLQYAQRTVFELKASCNIVIDNLSKFIEMVDTVAETLSEDQEKTTQEYIEVAHGLIDHAQCLAIQLEALALSTQNRDLHSAPPENTYGVGEQANMERPKLPAIPIPIFSGKPWEFTNFWTLFETNVHHQTLSNLQKFNYLLNALRGEALESIKRYSITEDNYEPAVELLKKKYGNDSQLISRLQSRLESTKTQNQSISAQRHLLEQIIPIVTQLQAKSVNLDGSFMAHKVLAKFAIRIQRKVLEKRVHERTKEADWKMKEIIEELDETISMEEHIDEMLQVNEIYSKKPENYVMRQNFNRASKTPFPCMFCASSEHAALNCTKYATLSERRSVFQQNNRCLNCGRQGHFANVCMKEGCRSCEGKKHHYTLCSQRQKRNGTPLLPNPTNFKSNHRNQTKEKGKKPENKVRAQVVQTNIESNQADLTREESNETLVLHCEEHRKQVFNAQVLLLTGEARVKGAQSGKWKQVEVLLDTGADQSFINERFARDLGLHCKETKTFTMYTFGAETPTTTTCGVTSLDLWDQNGERHNIRLCVTPALMSLGKAVVLSPKDAEFIEKHKISLSKGNFKEDSVPQILLGCDQLWELLDSTDPQYTLPSGLKLIPSRLGYLLTGKQDKINKETQSAHKAFPIVNAVNVFMNWEEELTRWDKYWAIDSAGICEYTGTKCAEKEAVNKRVASFFEQTIERRSDGYYVRLPYKDNHPPLPSNKAIALRRLESSLNMLQSRPKLLENYDQTFKEQAEKGIIEEIPNDQAPEGKILHYIPHQAVITPQKETTKMRIVFDASSHYRQCPSLNDILHQGPLILPEIYEMLLRFRAKKYVLTADVEKAFLQVRLNECDRDATRFYWVRNPSAPVDDDNIITYRFTRVPFGLNVSPFLLAATVNYHLKNMSAHKLLAKEIEENLYVDNVILGADSAEEMENKAEEARDIFAEIGMNLREFLSNTHAVRDKIPIEACAKSSEQKVLGVTWKAENDELAIQCVMSSTSPITKREVARQIASIYDPFGWLTPLITRAKHFQQELWKQRYSWDGVLSEELSQEWNTIVNDANGFQRLIPRMMLPELKHTKLAIFADASEIAMAACAYLFKTGNATLIMAKCKLPSIRSTTTIPKMEMNALTIAARLALSIYRALQKSAKINQISQIFLFSDSQIVLNWVSNMSNGTNAGVLINNRLKEIRKIVLALKEEGAVTIFKYISSKDNPADAGTRGLTRLQLESHFWWHGPEFLLQPIETWTLPTYEVKVQADTETQCFKMTTTPEAKTQNLQSALLDLNRYSSLEKAKRIAAHVLVFICKLMRTHSFSRKKKIMENIPELKSILPNLPLNGSTIKAARLALVKNHQQQIFSESLRKSLENSLRLFQDDQKIWRSKGRLGNSPINESAKNPIYIGPNTPLAKLIIHEAHGNYHRGIDHTIATVRTRYWIPKLRQQVRKEVSRCANCKRFNSLPYAYPYTSDLPERRVQISRPFQHVGLDFFDLPISKENSEQRKTYGCIFTCTVTRLVHLELVQSMAIGDFLNALKRFIARRGIPTSITCDNAPTFLLCEVILGAEKGISDLNEELARTFANQEIHWYHITPYAPWQGGFYERIIKSIKHALYKALRCMPMPTVDQLATFLTEIEACLNSRPLTYQSADLEEISALRPIDFLQKEIVLTLPQAHTRSQNQDPDYLLPQEIQALKTRREAEEALEKSQKHVERFWKIWKHQYLTSLREKHKKCVGSKRSGQQTPKVGSVVLITDSVLPRNEWRLGRITKLLPGADNQVREVELVTSTKRKIHRPVNLLVPLELDDEEPKNPTLQEQETPQEPTQNIPSQRENLRYELRARKPIQYTETVTTKAPTTAKPSKHWFLFHLMILLMQFNFGRTEVITKVSCAQNGVTVASFANTSLEICAETFCEVRKNDQDNTHFVRPPAEIALHDYLVTVKWIDNGRINTISTRCPALDFCRNIDCMICAKLLFNPECWPNGAIFLIAFILYIGSTMLYTLLWIAALTAKSLKFSISSLRVICTITLRIIGKCIIYIVRKMRRHRYSRAQKIAAALALFTVVIEQQHFGVLSCQEINVLEHQSTSCIVSKEKETCKTSITEVLKLNSFMQEACLRLVKNTSLFANVKIRWRGLRLTCAKESAFFTRATNLHVIDSKRCAHMGSCVGSKCAEVNESTLVPELSKGNQYPGRTGCLESCGGIGCDCFYPSAGCLFYRIYATPQNSEIYEIFRCAQWKEDVKVEVIVEELKLGKRSYIIAATPNIPISLPSLKITLSVCAVPPIPFTTQEFITNGIDTALWSNDIEPNLRCETKEKAAELNCSFSDNCRCEGAENKVNCQCLHPQIQEEFGKIQRKLPLKSPFWELSLRKNQLTAHIPHMVSAEFIANFDKTFETALVEVDNNICIINDSHLSGCYNCAKGAEARIDCKSEATTLGEVLCQKDAFVIPCAPSSPQSTLRFHFSSARQNLNCTIKCGTKSQTFTISGILKYVGSLHHAALIKLKGNSAIYHEMSWPDFGHIAELLFSWYKTVLIALIAIAGALLCTYLCLQSLGWRLLVSVLKVVFALTLLPVRLGCYAVRMIGKQKGKTKRETGHHIKNLSR